MSYKQEHIHFPPKRPNYDNIWNEQKHKWNFYSVKSQKEIPPGSFLLSTFVDIVKGEWKVWFPPNNKKQKQ